MLWHCWLGGRQGIRPVKTEWWGAGMVICLERGADLFTAQLMPLPLTVSCFSKIQIGFTFLVLAHLDSPGKGPLNGCVYVKCWMSFLCHPIWCLVHTLLLLSPFNGLISKTTWVNWYQKGKTSLDINKARDYGVLGCSGIRSTICKQITTTTPHHSIFTDRMLFLMPNEQCQSTDSTLVHTDIDK